ncbi:transcription factor bHLH140 [Coffea eugenioides]|uniref:transcription factor bHLH140 n=1 Tax=Coffea eugenioides TaxID=49369 RepID=UPI000F60B2BA|nr:transcription factor bHLH140 [Coffea eugenioides]
MEPMDLHPQTASREIAKEEEGAQVNVENGKPVVVIMVGAPGSGKSTFCDHVIRTSARPWVRICQDTIGNGKAGTKIACIKSASNALEEGKSVFIDRCNMDGEQRGDFLKLGNPEVEKHAVVLDLPAKLCISRSVKRTGHEGNLQGGKAAAVVNRMLQKKEFPKLAEGFTRITFCHNEKDVEAAMNTYSTLGLFAVLPSGCFGQKNPEAKVQLGIMRFLKKVDIPGKDGLVESNPQHSSDNQSTVEKDSGSRRPANDSAPSEYVHMDVKNTVSQESGSSIRTNSVYSIPTLAFPSISTADFQFNLDKASDIIVEKVEEFVSKLGNARLVLVDLSHGSKILSLVKAKAARKSIDSKKFFTFVGDITRLYSQGGMKCNVIANAANWRLKPGGGGVNAAIFSAAGPALETATKERAESLAPGKALVVPLPSTSPLSIKEGVTHVIHVLGPNMNAQRPNCLNNDYVKGCKVLGEAYSSLFEGFASILSTQGWMPKESNEKSLKSQNQIESKHHDGDQKVKREALNECMGGKKSKIFLNELKPNFSHSVDRKGNIEGRKNVESLNEFERNKNSGGFLKELKPSASHSVDRKENLDGRDDTGMNKAWGPWAQSLYQFAMHPERHRNDLREILDDVVVLDDLYPKARKHLLVLARVEGLDRLADVSKEHLPLLNTMHAVGLKWAEKLLNENESLVFRLGYHSEPSMRQLHLHVISQDFDSKHLKNKKHWNSFNTPFFRDSVDVLQEVSKHGKAIIRDDDSFRSMELRCHRCRSAHPNIPRLKTHISSCQAPFPGVMLDNGKLVFAPGKIR